MHSGVGKAAPAGQNCYRRRRNFTDVQVQTLLTEYKDVKVLNFTSMVGAFSRFEDLEDAKSFQPNQKVRGDMVLQARNPGHIWYDMEFDIVPHVDRHNRKWDGGRTSGSWSRGLDVAEMFLSFFHSFFLITWTRAPLLRGRSEPARLRGFDLMGLLRSHRAAHARSQLENLARLVALARSRLPYRNTPLPRQPGKSRTVTSGL